MSMYIFIYMYIYIYIQRERERDVYVYRYIYIYTHCFLYLPLLHISLRLGTVLELHSPGDYCHTKFARFAPHLGKAGRQDLSQPAYFHTKPKRKAN